MKSAYLAPNDKPIILKFISLTRRLGIDPFLIGLLSAILIAYLWPEPGIRQGFFSLESAAGAGVSLIFFFYGLRLSPEKLRSGLANWKLHIAVQSTTFIAFPLIALGFYQLFSGERFEYLWMGAFYLAALPSTVSSSVVMVSIAGGNIAAAIFNASISSLIGVFMTPVWMGLFIKSQTGAYDLWEVIPKLIVQVLVPVALGIILNQKWGAFAERHKKALRYFDQAIILLIVYTSFCDSFARKMFQDYQLHHLLILAALLIAFFFLMFGFVHVVSLFLKFNREDRITAIFCGSKKSLVHGTVMSKALFPDANITGIILLPLMLYHALQLVAASLIAKRMANGNGVKKRSETP